jgi:hypothetical protein
MRYIVTDGQVTPLCCSEFTILDTARPASTDRERRENEIGKHFAAVCECFCKADAERICAALNAAEDSAGSCRWDWSSYHGVEITTCGHGITADSQYKFCPFCGKKIAKE